MFNRKSEYIEQPPVTNTPLRVAVMELLRNLVRQTNEQASEMPTSQRLMLQTFSGLILAKISTLPDKDLRELVLAVANHSGNLVNFIPADDR